MRAVANNVSSTIKPEHKRDALLRVLQSDTFGGAERLKQFLTYVVEEEVAGRGEEIRGKTIAHDVFDRNPSLEGDNENIVRVDARRLRQLLDLYYETAGKTDPVRIHMDSGGYCPRFEPRVAHSPQSNRLGAIAVPILTFAAGGILGFLLSPGLFGHDERVQIKTEIARKDPSLSMRREAILDKSAASLQAVNLAEQARSMIFPIFDRERQLLIRGAFQRVIALDPDYFGGYAGEAQVVATLSILNPKGPEKDQLLAFADQLVNEAVRLNPGEAWTQSALAWVELAKGDYDRAFQLSKRASQIDPRDGHTLDFHGAVSLFSGNFSEAIAASDRQQVQGGSNQRFANRNIVAAASFHLGDLQRSLEGFQEAAQYGDPLSAPSLAYQIAALDAMGRRNEAKTKLSELARAWPDAPLEEMLYGIYRDRINADSVLDHLRSLGWKKANRE